MDLGKDIAYILQGIGVVIAAVVIHLANKGVLIHRKVVMARKEWIQGIEDMRAIRNEHYNLHVNHDIPINAFLIAHNGGKAPSKERDFFTSMKDETGVDIAGAPVFPRLGIESDRVRVDFAYARMIEEVYRDGHVHYRDVHQMEDCMLKRMCLAEGIVEVVLVAYSLELESFRFGYAKHGRYNNGEPFNEEQIEAILMSGNRLRTKFGTLLNP